jgi:hypothetical protein
MLIGDVEHLISPGDLLLFRGGLLHSRAIQRWTRSVYSHVGIAHHPCSVGQSSLDVLEAREGTGVITQPLRSYLERGDAVDWFRITDPTIDRFEVVRWAWDRRGKRYASYQQLVRSFVTLPIAKWLGLDTCIDRGRWFCSFFAAEALRAGGWVPPGDDALPNHLASPGGVALFPCLQRQGPLRLM